MIGGRPPFFVITGGPGAGKSTLLSKLAEAGFATVPESGRAIIREQRALGGPGLPWASPLHYARLMAAREAKTLEAARRLQGPVFFDRGLPAIVGYFATLGRPAPAWLLAKSRTAQYAPLVFLAPHWPAIYGLDSERRQSTRQAAITCAAMRQVYGALGYRVLDLPFADVTARLAFVLTASRACL